MSFVDNSGKNKIQPYVSVPDPQVFDYPVTQSNANDASVDFSGDSAPSSDSSTIRPLTNGSGPLGPAEMFSQNQGIIFDNSANVESNRMAIDAAYNNITSPETVGPTGAHTDNDTTNHNMGGGLPKGAKI